MTGSPQAAERDEPAVDAADLPRAIADYLDAYGRNDLPAILACVSDDLVFEQISNATGITRLEGRDAFAPAAAMSAKALRRRRILVRSLLTSIAPYVMEIRYLGEVVADLPNGWTAGQKIDLLGVAIFDLGEGKITRMTFYT